MNAVYSWLAAAAVVVALWGGGYLQGKHRAEAVHQLAELQQAADLAKIENARAAAFEAERTTLLAEVARLETENAKLPAAVESGAVRLHVRTTCPRVPAADPAGGAADEPAELDPVARQDYYALRSAIVVTESRLATCLAFARGLSLDPARLH